MIALAMVVTFCATVLTALRWTLGHLAAAHASRGVEARIDAANARLAALEEGAKLMPEYVTTLNAHTRDLTSLQMRVR